MHSNPVPLFTTSCCIMYCQSLKRSKDDIAERHYDFTTISNKVLTKDPEGVDLLSSFHSKSNPVKMMHKVIEHCLKTEDRAERFLNVLLESNRCLYVDLVHRGPQGRAGEYNHMYTQIKGYTRSTLVGNLIHIGMCVSVRKDPPAVQLTDKARTALGDKVCDLWTMPMQPSYNKNITSIMPALDVLYDKNQLLPEEFAEFRVNQDDHNSMIVKLEELCLDITIPEPSRRFIALVVSSCNMHVFGIPNLMSMEDVIVFA